MTAVTPYLCYARKDRRTKPNDPIITRYVAAMFESVGIDRVIVSEVHNVAAFENAFRCPTWHIESAPLFAAHFAPLLRDETVVAVSPDAGGAKRAEQFRQALEHLMMRKDVGSAYMEKYRSSGVVSGELLAGDVRDRVTIIVDDLISTGHTLLRAANAVRVAGADRVMALVTHGLFMPGAEAALRDPAIDRFLVANSVPPFGLAPGRAGEARSFCGRAALAETICRLHDGARFDDLLVF